MQTFIPVHSQGVPRKILFWFSKETKTCKFCQCRIITNIFSKSVQEGYSNEEYKEKFGTKKLNKLWNAKQEKLEIAKQFNSSQKAS
jgi:hypothetical protein